MSLAKLQERFSTNPVKSQQGIWIDIPLDPGEPVPGFKIGRMGITNPKWSTMAGNDYREHRVRIEAGQMPAEESRQRAIVTFCHTILFDWRNVDDAKGNQIIYTPEEGIKLLTVSDLLYDRLHDEAKKDANFQDYFINKTVGN